VRRESSTFKASALFRRISVRACGSENPHADRFRLGARVVARADSLRRRALLRAGMNGARIVFVILQCARTLKIARALCFPARV
jgi:hypothetical protein